MRRFDLNDFGRDFTYETLAYLSPRSNQISMCICENETLIYARERSELVVLSLRQPKDIQIIRLNENEDIRDLLFVDWLKKCFVLTRENLYLFDYRSKQLNLIEIGFDYRCGTIDNLHQCFYLVEQTTLKKFDSNSLIKMRADEIPIADGFQSRHLTLDNRKNELLALLVFSMDEEKNYILVYSTTSLADGYLYKIIIDDRIDRHWICSTGDDSWLVQGNQSGLCWNLNLQGLSSIRMFDRYEIRNLIPMNGHERFLIRTETEIFVLMKLSF